MGTLGFAILFGFGGILAAVIYTFIIGLAGIPGALISAAAAKRSTEGVTPVWGVLLTVAGQLYASLAFVALVIHFIEIHHRWASELGKWVIWTIAFLVAITPTSIAIKDAAYADRKNVQHYAMACTAPLTALGFFLFMFFPTIMNAGWGWVPNF